MFGLYLHIPFCQHKCSYCDFYSIERTEQIDQFVPLLVQEIRMRAAEWSRSAPEVTSVFFGGGTPSLLRPHQIDVIVSELRAHFRFSVDCEWTMECNPGTVSAASLKAYHDCGINRLSFGVQSFHEQELRFLERIHSVSEAEQAVALAREAGFDNVSVDLMFALPSQTLESYALSLQKALSLGTEHISAYSLIFEEGTPLYAQLLAHEVEQQDEEADLAMYEFTMEQLSKHGYGQYEVSNFAKRGRECRHNQCYWRGDEYIAFGPSAHGYVNNTRYWNVRNLRRYSESLHKGELPTLNSELLSVHDRMFERAFLELRSSGIDVVRFNEDFSIDLSAALGETSQWLLSDGFVRLDERFALTHKGYAHCDDITVKVMSAIETASKTAWRHIRAPREHEDSMTHELPILSTK